MIIAGDYIESSIGVYMAISTMAAAALGNTISDIFGLGRFAWERWRNHRSKCSLLHI